MSRFDKLRDILGTAPKTKDVQTPPALPPIPPRPPEEQAKVVNGEVFKRYDCLLISPGGSGSTYIHRILDQASLKKNLLSDDDNLKHLSSPRNSIFRASRFDFVLYVYNDPLLSILSHFRRGWQSMQHKKIVADAEKVLEPNILADFASFQNATLKADRDIFGMSDHFYAWFNLSNDPDTNFSAVDFRNPTHMRDTLKQRFDVDIDYKIEARENQYAQLEMSPRFVEIYKELDAQILRDIARLNA